MLRLLILPLDGSSFGEQALPTAIHLAEGHGGRWAIDEFSSPDRYYMPRTR